jgi:hypothetical protein
MEFFLGVYDIIKEDLMRVVEKSISYGKFLATLNATFISLIPKSNNPSTFGIYRPINLCNCIYNITSKIIAIRIKRLFSKSISNEQFGFLEGREIHEAIWVTQEGIHFVKTRSIKAMLVKVDFSNTYDRVIYVYLSLILMHLGFFLPFVN